MKHLVWLIPVAAVLGVVVVRAILAPYCAYGSVAVVGWYAQPVCVKVGEKANVE